jgi:hypothetical protein
METKKKPEQEPEPTFGRVYDQETQRKIVAWLIYDQKAWPEPANRIKSEYFDNPVNRDIVRLIKGYVKGYNHLPTQKELLQELELFLNHSVNLPPEEYHSQLRSILEEFEGTDFTYARDKAMEFVKFQAVRNAIIKSLDILEGDQNYETMRGVLNSALDIDVAGGPEEKLDFVMASDVPEESLEWLWQNTFPKAGLSVLCGMPESGKSWFLTMVAARISSGRPFPKKDHLPVEKGRVLILQSEDSWAQTVRRRLEWEGADLSNVAFVKGVKDRNEEIRPVDLSTDLATVKHTMNALGGGGLIIVDPLDMYVGLYGRMDANKAHDVRVALRPLEEFIEKEKVTVIGLMHLNKKEDASAIFRLSGSGAWAQVPRVIWTIIRDREDPELFHFLALKNNTIPWEDKMEAQFCFRIPKGVDRIEVAPDVEPISVQEALQPETPEDARERKSKRELAETILEGLEKDYSDQQEGIPANVIQEGVKEIGRMTWKRVRDARGWTTRQMPWGWMWYPPHK